MSVIEKIKIIVDKVGGLEFMYDDWNRVDKRVSNMARSIETPEELKEPAREGKLPGCFVIIPSQGAIDTSFSIYKDTPLLFINFCIDTEFDFDGLRNESLINRMKDKAMDFIYHYNTSGLFEPLPQIVEYMPLYNILADNLTGIQIKIRAKEIEGKCYI